MTFSEALRAATKYGEALSETHPHSDKPPTRLPPSMLEQFDDARKEALISRAREAFWMHRYWCLRYEYAKFQHRLEDRA